MGWYAYIEFIVVHYLILLAFLFFAALIGKMLVRKSLKPEGASKIFLYISLGTGVFIVVLFFAALLNLFTVLYLSLMTSTFLVFYLLRKKYTTFLNDIYAGFRTCCSSLRKNCYWVLPLGVLFSPLFLMPLYPPIKWDEISYHLPYAQFYIENQGLAVNHFLRYPLYAHNIDLLYALSLLVSDDIVAHLLHASTAVLTAIGIYSLGATTSDKKTGVLAAFLFISCPLVLLLIKTAYIDLGLTLFVFLGFYCLSMWSVTKQDYWLYLAGFATGIAAGSKYSGLMFIPLYVLWIGYERRKITLMVKFLIPAIAFGSPWYIRNYIISGDPFSPFGGEFFGYWLWNKSDVLAQSQNLFKAYGTPKNLFSLIIIPWNLLFHPGAFMEGALSPAMTAAFLAPFFFKKFGRYQRMLCIFVFVNICIWFFTSQILRYLLPVFPMIALLSATVLMRTYNTIMEKLRSYFFKSHFSARLLQIAFSIAAIAIVIAPSFVGVRTMESIKKALHGIKALKSINALQSPYENYLNFALVKATLRDTLPITEHMRDDYLRKHVRAFNLLQVANRTPSLTIYQIGFEDSFYFAEGKMIGDHYGPARYTIVLDVLPHSERLHTTLSSMGIDLFLMDKGERFTLDFDSAFHDYFELIAEDHHGKLYRLKRT
jgi:4-amino-4-deoxy-L-arabinose transferase-like glycosyltransferase